MPASGGERTRLSNAKRPRTQADADDDDDPPVRRPRHRVSEACEACRKRKDRCNGERPTCDNCMRTRRNCTYRQNRKRGLRTGYVRALETLLGLLFVTVRGTDAWLTSLLDGHEEAPLFHLQALENPPAGDSVEPLLDAWRTSAVLKQVEHVLSAAEATDDGDGTEAVNDFDRRASQAMVLAAGMIHDRGSVDDHNVQPLYFPSPMHTESTSPDNTISQPPVAPAAPIPTQNQQIDPSLPDPGSQTPVAHNTTLPQAQQQQHTLRQLEASSSNCLPANWGNLLGLHFTSTHCWLPICEKHDLLRSAHLLAACRENGAVLPDVSQGDRAFLMTVLAYSSSQAVPDLGSTHPYQPETLLAATKNFFPDLNEAYELGHVRALLILVLVRIQLRDRKGAWSAVGRAVYALTTMEGFACLHPHLGPSLDDGIKRTALCCMALDSIVAAWVSVRPYFQRSDIINIGLLRTEGLEEWEPWIPYGTSSNCSLSQHTPSRVLSTFNSFIESVGFLNDVLKFAGGFSGHNDPTVLRQSSQDWMTHLSSLESIGSASNATPHSINLHWFAANLTETLKAQLSDNNYLQDINNTHQNLRKLGDMLQDIVRNIGPCVVPPTCIIYISALRLKIVDRFGSLNEAEAEALSLRSLLLELDQPLHFIEGGPPVSMNEQVHIRPSTRGGSGVMTASSSEQQGYTKGSRKDVPSILETDFPALSTEASAVNPAALAPETGLLDHDLSDLQMEIHPLPEQGQVDIVGNTNTNIVDFGPSDMDEDGLFQSLADLDSADWSANPPDFMKHLGIMNDVTTGLDTFFDINLG